MPFREPFRESNFLLPVLLLYCTFLFHQIMVDLDQCLEQSYEGKLLSEIVVEQLCFSFKELLIKDPNVLHMRTPVTVVGDIHGQFYDLLEIFKIGGTPPQTNYLFLGDYVDRGFHSVETIIILIILKLKYPSRIHLIRGNHESRQITLNYGFYTECLTKYGGSSRVWELITDTFDYLILSVIIDDSIFCIHGGLSPNIQSIESIKVIDRYKEIPHEGPMADLVWSDPDIELLNFQISSRGAGYQFGLNVVNKFLSENKFDKIIRAHQLCNEGYQLHWGGKVVTVWSAPNYCYRCGNMASIMEIFDSFNGPESSRFNIFDASPSSNQEYLKFIGSGMVDPSNHQQDPDELDEESQKRKEFDDQFFNEYFNGIPKELDRKAPQVEYFL